MEGLETTKTNSRETITPFFSNNRNQERELKGKSLIGIVDNYVVIDIETTGLDVCCDEIIEVAAAKVEEGIIVKKFTSLIKPEKEINAFITDLTGITNEMVATAPTAENVLQDFVNFIGSGLIIGHNVNFDINFLYDNCQEKIGYTFSNDFLDTLRLSRMLFGKERQHKLSDLIKRFGIGQVVEHRALGDVLQTQKCYEYMLGYGIDNGVKMRHLYGSGRRKKKENIASNMDSLFGE